MHLKNIEKRAKAESQAVFNILNYMKDAGCEFSYSESTHIYPTFNNNFIFDSDLVSFIAGNICLSLPQIKFVAIGVTKTDTSQTNLSERAKRGQQIFSAFGSQAEKIFPVSHLTKREIYNFLPIDLKNLTWSCRTPIYESDDVAIPCNTCKTCLEMAKLNE